MDESTERTLGRWFDLCHRARVPLTTATDMAEQLAAAYGAPHRHYHTMRHIESCLALLERARLEPADRIDAEFAVWFHDAVYDPTRPDNEARSAAFAATWLTAQGLDPARVAALVEMTADHGVPDDPDPLFGTVHDIDLAVLGAGADDYDSYAAAIRLEYAHIDDPVYALGRAAVLQRFLDLDRIYALPALSGRLERSARANLERELSRLGEDQAGGVDSLG